MRSRQRSLRAQLERQQQLLPHPPLLLLLSFFPSSMRRLFFYQQRPVKTKRPENRRFDAHRDLLLLLLLNYFLLKATCTTDPTCGCWPFSHGASSACLGHFTRFHIFARVAPVSLRRVARRRRRWWWWCTTVESCLAKKRGTSFTWLNMNKSSQVV